MTIGAMTVGKIKLHRNQVSTCSPVQRLRANLHNILIRLGSAIALCTHLLPCSRRYLARYMISRMKWLD